MEQTIRQLLVWNETQDRPSLEENAPDRSADFVRDCDRLEQAADAPGVDRVSSRPGKFHQLLCLVVGLGSFIGSTAPASAQSVPAWTQLAPTGVPPLARAAHSAILEPVTSQMLVFGGTHVPDFNDLWSLTTSGSPQWTSVTPAGVIPAGRVGHSAVYDAANSRMTIFGGGLGQSSPCANDVWVLSNANRVNGTPTWTQLAPTGTAPVPRIFHTSVYDPASNRMMVFGGNNCFSAGAVFHNDVWVLSNANGLGGTPAWTQILPAGTPPPTRENLSTVYDAASNRMIVFGGSNGTVFNDVWILSNANGLGGVPAWTQLLPAGTLIPARNAHTAVYDPASNRMTVFGGGNSSVSFTDVWVLSNANGLTGIAAWTQLSLTTPTGIVMDKPRAVYDVG
jgi:hypothetical protein